MKIKYDDKVSVNIDETIDDINKLKDEDINEIKRVVNTNDDILTEAVTAIEDIKKLDLGDTMPIGSVVQWFEETAPDNWLVLNGQAVSRIDYPELFVIYGTKYGEGDGSTTFNLPNLKGRVITGLDSNDNDFNELGKVSGEKMHILSVGEMPSHNHTIICNNVQGGTLAAATLTYGRPYTSVDYNTIKNAGESLPHNNMQPYIVANFIVKAYKQASTMAVVQDNLNDNSVINAPSVNAVNQQFNVLKPYVIFANKDRSASGEFTYDKGNKINLKTEGFKYLEWYILDNDNRQGYVRTDLELRGTPFEWTWFGGTTADTTYSYLYSITCTVDDSGFNIYRIYSVTRERTALITTRVSTVGVIKVVGYK